MPIVIPPRRGVGQCVKQKANAPRPPFNQTGPMRIPRFSPAIAPAPPTAAVKPAFAVKPAPTEAAVKPAPVVAAVLPYETPVLSESIQLKRHKNHMTSWLSRISGKEGEMTLSESMLVVAGPPGCGKTVMVRQFLRMNFTTRECGILDFPGVERVVDNTVVKFVDGTRNALVLEDLGELFEKMPRLLKIKARCPCIGICEVLPKAMRGKVKNVLRLYKFNHAQSLDILSQIPRPIRDKEKVAKHCNGDGRQLHLSAAYRADELDVENPFKQFEDLGRGKFVNDEFHEFMTLLVHENAALVMTLEDAAALFEDICALPDDAYFHALSYKTRVRKAPCRIEYPSVLTRRTGEATSLRLEDQLRRVVKACS